MAMMAESCRPGITQVNARRPVMMDAPMVTYSQENIFRGNAGDAKSIQVQGAMHFLVGLASMVFLLIPSSVAIDGLTTRPAVSAVKRFDL